MTPSFIVVALGAVAAVAGTGLLAARCARAPRVFLIALTIAMFGLAVAQAAQAIGDLAGYSGALFRAMELGGQALAPLALCWALAELAGGSLPARFGMRLAAAAIGVVVFVVLGTDPLNPGEPLGKAWPQPSLHYETIPKALIDFLAGFALLTGAAGALVVGMRAWRGRGRDELVQPSLVVAGATALVAIPGISAALHLPVPAKDLYALTCALATGLVWFAVHAAEHRGLVDEPLHGAPEPAGYPDRDRRAASASGPGAREDDWYERDDDYPRDGGRGGHGPREAAGPEVGLSYPGLAALAAEPAERSRVAGGPPRHDQYRQPGQDGAFDDSGSWDDPAWFGSDAGQGGPERYAADEDAGYGRGRYGDEPDSLAGPDDYGPGPGAVAAGVGELPGAEPRGGLFGQIAIYTLLEDRIDDFDRLTGQVVEQVRAAEPGTLAYIVHAVPTAPLQRILYEVYADRAAYEEHKSRPYVAAYEAERRRLVLATNVIELDLRQAKVSPFPSYSAISDILSESGIDLTGVTGPRPGQRGRERGTVRREVPPASGGYPPGSGGGGYPPGSGGYPPGSGGYPPGSGGGGYPPASGGYPPDDRYGRPPQGRPGPGPAPGPGQDQGGGDPRQDGWAGLRRDDRGYR